MGIIKQKLKQYLKSKGYFFRDDFALLRQDYSNLAQQCGDLIREMDIQRELAKEHTLIIDKLSKILLDNTIEELKKRRFAVYTSITGGYDDLRKPLYVDENCDYFCITDDKNLTSDFWNMIYLDEELQKKYDTCRLQRYVKTHPHIFFPQYEESIYIDGKMCPQKSLMLWLAMFQGDAPMLAFRHFERDCIFQEAEACKFLGKDVPEIMDRQMEEYRAEGYPEHYGLIDSAVLYRKHNDPRVIEVNEAWFHEIMTKSRRDQLSFNYVCWKLHFAYDQCPMHIYYNTFLTEYSHNT